MNTTTTFEAREQRVFDSLTDDGNRARFVVSSTFRARTVEDFENEHGPLIEAARADEFDIGVVTAAAAVIQHASESSAAATSDEGEAADHAPVVASAGDAAQPPPAGATPEQWQHAVHVFGVENLLPIVADRSLPASKHSKTKDIDEKIGKVPMKIRADGVVGFGAWQAHHATAKDIERWSSDDRYGIGVQARAVRAIDIDVEDQDLAQRVREFVYAWLTQRGLVLPDVRGRDGSGKCLLPFKVAGDIGKQTLTLPPATSGAKQVIEFLADGNQWVCQSTHPSGKRYVWSDSDGAPLRNPTTLGVLKLEQWNELRLAIRDEFNATEGAPGKAGTRSPRKPLSRALVRDWSWDKFGEWIIANWQGVRRPSGPVDFHCPGHHDSGDYSHGSTTWFPPGTLEDAGEEVACLHSSCEGHKNTEFFRQLAAEQGFDRADAEGFIDESEEAERSAARDADGAVVVRPASLTVNSRTGRIEADLVGIVAALNAPSWSGVCVVNDTFDNEPRIRFAKRAAPASWSPNWLDGFEKLNDDHIAKARLALVHVGFKQPAKDDMWSAVSVVRGESQVDSAKLWLGSLKWDGTPRIERFFTDCWHCSDPSEYLAAVSRYVWLALAGRVLWPGVKADMMPVVKGAQGCGKSRGCEAMALPGLAGSMDFGERTLDDAVLYMRGLLVIEFAEMAGLSKREAETVKSFLSKGTDRYRMRFDRVARDWPRRSLFVGTTNADQFLIDETGHRRFLPVEVREGQRVDVDRIEHERDQLWAEARAVLEQQGQRALIDAAIAAERLGKVHNVHEERVVREDGFTDEVRAVLGLPAPGTDADFDTGSVARLGDGAFVMRDVLRGLGIAPERQNRAVEHRVGAALRALGYERKKVRVHGESKWTWVRKENGQ